MENYFVEITKSYFPNIEIPQIDNRKREQQLAIEE